MHSDDTLIHDSKLKFRLFSVCVCECIFLNPRKRGAGKGRRGDVGLGEGGHGSLLWPELALAAPVLKGYSDGAGVEGGGGEG